MYTNLPGDEMAAVKHRRAVLDRVVKQTWVTLK